ncbi:MULTISPECIES: hypothetical protein [unclassified Streptomyces]|uniref:hypothetical protein n=1 Tax=unclassified Streptomyces TaxID=2593676 RepID=UPI00283AA654|nr:hypothetical protein [Streptomyces sp. PsTaAH-137]
MEKHPGPAPASSEGCLVAAVRMPMRIVALVVVVPVRLVWDALVTAGRFLCEKALVPLGRGVGLLLYWVLIWPLVQLARGLAFLGRVLVVVPLAWLYARVLAPVGRALAVVLAWVGRALFVWPWVWLWRQVLVPMGRGLGLLFRQFAAGVAALGRILLVVPAVWLYARVLTPLGHAIALLVRWILVLPALALWRWVLLPVGRALGVLLREIGDALGVAWRVAGYVSLAVGRFLGTLLRRILVEPVRWAYRRVLTPVGHVVRDRLWRPAARVVRETLGAVRATVRQVRADVRRALFGPDRPPEPLVTEVREPEDAQGRTLGSSTAVSTGSSATALTKTAFIKD